MASSTTIRSTICYLVKLCMWVKLQRHLKNISVYLFLLIYLAMSGLCCTMQDLSLQGMDSNCAQAQQLRCSGPVAPQPVESQFPDQPVESQFPDPMSPALQGRFLTTGSPGKSPVCRHLHPCSNGLGASLVVQWLRLCTPNLGGLGSIPGWGTGSHMLQLEILHVAMKIEDLMCYS